MQLPNKGTAARAIADFLYNVGSAIKDEVVASIPSHEKQTILNALTDMSADRLIHRDDSGYRLGASLTAEFDRLVGKHRPVVQPAYHNIWTPPMRGYEAAMRRGVRS